MICLPPITKTDYLSLYCTWGIQLLIKNMCDFFLRLNHRPLRRLYLEGFPGEAVHSLAVSEGSCSPSFRPLQLAALSHLCIPTSGPFIPKSLYLISSSDTNTEASCRWRGEGNLKDILPTGSISSPSPSSPTHCRDSELPPQWDNPGNWVLADVYLMEEQSWHFLWF